MSNSQSRGAMGASTIASGQAEPAGCPACGSPSIVTSAKHPTTASYWRCRRCGEIWNASRRTERRRWR